MNGDRTQISKFSIDFYISYQNSVELRVQLLGLGHGEFNWGILRPVVVNISALNIPHCFDI